MTEGKGPSTAADRAPAPGTSSASDAPVTATVGWVTWRGQLIWEPGMTMAEAMARVDRVTIPKEEDQGGGDAP